MDIRFSTANPQRGSTANPQRGCSLQIVIFLMLFMGAMVRLALVYMSCRSRTMHAHAMPTACDASTITCPRPPLKKPASY